MKFKFAVGDKVRVKLSESKFDIDYNGDMEKFDGREVTISKLDVNTSDRCHGPIYRIEEDEWFWAEDWFEPIGNNETNMITISFDPSNKTAAHKMVEEAIKNYYAPKDWTEEEVEQAKDLVCEMAMSLIRNNGEVFFRKGTYDDNIIHCAIYLNSFNSYPDRETKSCPYGNDVFNVWIGKCVALCKALKKPIPDFIRYKNT